MYLYSLQNFLRFILKTIKIIVKGFKIFKCFIKHHLFKKKQNVITIIVENTLDSSYV